MTLVSCYYMNGHSSLVCSLVNQLIIELLNLIYVLKPVDSYILARNSKITFNQ